MMITGTGICHTISDQDLFNANSDQAFEANADTDLPWGANVGAAKSLIIFYRALRDARTIRHLTTCHLATCH
jgi:hypothetical protein